MTGHVNKVCEGASAYVSKERRYVREVSKQASKQHDSQKRGLAECTSRMGNREDGKRETGEPRGVRFPSDRLETPLRRASLYDSQSSACLAVWRFLLMERDTNKPCGCVGWLPTAHLIQPIPTITTFRTGGAHAFPLLSRQVKPQMSARLQGCGCSRSEIDKIRHQTDKRSTPGTCLCIVGLPDQTRATLLVAAAPRLRTKLTRNVPTSLLSSSIVQHGVQ